MRTHYTTLVTALFGMSASAQVVFDLPDALPSPGTHVQQGWEWDGTPFTLATSGTNVTWDVTGVLTAGSARTTMESAPAGTPGAGDFPNATHAHGEVINGFTTWYYYRLDAGDTLWLEGARYQGGELLECSSPNLFMVFPCSIGDLAESNTTCTYDGGSPISVNQGLEPVATGTILYPGGTITDVVLTRAHYNGSPSDYYWYRSGNVLEWIGNFDPGFVLSLWAEVPSGIADPGNTVRLNAYPLPASEEVFVEVADRAGSVPFSVLDAAGRTLNSGMVNVIGGRVRLDVSDMPNGHYLLQLMDDGVPAIAPIVLHR